MYSINLLGNVAIEDSINNHFHEFINLCVDYLGIQVPFKIYLTSGRVDGMTTAVYTPMNNNMFINISERKFVDILRSIAHELTHHKQNQNNELNSESPNIGSPQEQEADINAGILIKKYCIENNNQEVYNIGVLLDKQEDLSSYSLDEEIKDTIELKNNNMVNEKEILKFTDKDNAESELDTSQLDELPSFRKIKLYLEEEKKLQKIGEGSARATYRLNNNLVLKVAKNNKGIAQNDVESDPFIHDNYSDIVANVKDYDEDDVKWLIVEEAKPLKTKKQLEKKLGVSLYYLHLFLAYEIDGETNFETQMALEAMRKINRNNVSDNFLTQLVNFIQEVDLELGDVLRGSSWGIVKRDGKELLVLIDYGFTSDVAREFYREEDEKFVNEYLSEEYSKVKNIIYKNNMPLAECDCNTDGTNDIVIQDYIGDLESTKKMIQELINKGLNVRHNVYLDSDTEQVEEKVENSVRNEYGCLMLMLNIPHWQDLLSNIKEEDLYEANSSHFGLEYEPHCTVVFGFKEIKLDIAKLKAILANYSEPLKLRLTDVSLFENELFDVLKIDVKSFDLEHLNTIINNNFDIEQLHDSYNPHITIAYLKKGMGKKYKEILSIEGNVVLSSNVFKYSYPDGKYFVHADEGNFLYSYNKQKVIMKEGYAGEEAKTSWLPQMNLPYDYMIQQFSKNNIKHDIVDIPVKKLIPIQKKIDSDNVKKFSKSVINPIFVSNDNHIIDGHHRYFYKKLKNPENYIKCIKIDKNVMDTIKLLNKIEDSYNFLNGKKFLKVYNDKEVNPYMYSDQLFLLDDSNNKYKHEHIVPYTSKYEISLDDYKKVKIENCDVIADKKFIKICHLLSPNTDWKSLSLKYNAELGRFCKDFVRKWMYKNNFDVIKIGDFMIYIY